MALQRFEEKISYDQMMKRYKRKALRPREKW